MSDQQQTIQELKDRVAQFTDERNWSKAHNARSLASSIVIEAAELLEHWQWDSHQPAGDDAAVVDELADILIYCIMFANAYNIDLGEAIDQKLIKAAEKYPSEAFVQAEPGTSPYLDIKREHRKNAT